jgi:hypothetical protein
MNQGKGIVPYVKLASSCAEAVPLLLVDVLASVSLVLSRPCIAVTSWFSMVLSDPEDRIPWRGNLYRHPSDFTSDPVQREKKKQTEVNACRIKQKEHTTINVAGRYENTSTCIPGSNSSKPLCQAGKRQTKVSIDDILMARRTYRDKDPSVKMTFFGKSRRRDPWQYASAASSWANGFISS